MSIIATYMYCSFIYILYSFYLIYGASSDRCVNAALSLRYCVIIVIRSNAPC